MSDLIYAKITPSGSRAGVMYGLPKIHKENIPVRPIISAIGTYNYKTAKYLVEILTPLVDHKYILKDTSEFVYKISTIDPKKDKYLISYDVVSLFTNIPTLETIEIILNRAFSFGLKLYHNLDSIQLKHTAETYAPNSTCVPFTSVRMKSGSFTSAPALFRSWLSAVNLIT